VPITPLLEAQTITAAKTNTAPQGPNKTIRPNKSRRNPQNKAGAPANALVQAVKIALALAVVTTASPVVVTSVIGNRSDYAKTRAKLFNPCALLRKLTRRRF